MRTLVLTSAVLLPGRVLDNAQRPRHVLSADEIAATATTGTGPSTDTMNGTAVSYDNKGAICSGWVAKNLKKFRVTVRGGEEIAGGAENLDTASKLTRKRLYRPKGLSKDAWY